MGVSSLGQASVPPNELRHDFHGQAHQARLNPGQLHQIPETGVELRQQLRTDVGDGWARQERMFQLAGQISADNRDRWSDFSGGRRPAAQRELGSVEIDNGRVKTRGVAGAAQEPGQKPNEQKVSGWERLDAAYAKAASYEELQRDLAGQLGRRAGIIRV
jgi:hypothetical protein